MCEAIRMRLCACAWKGHGVTHSVAENFDLLLSDGLGIKELSNHLVDIHQRTGENGRKKEKKKVREEENAKNQSLRQHQKDRLETQRKAKKKGGKKETRVLFTQKEKD